MFCVRSGGTGLVNGRALFCPSTDVSEQEVHMSVAQRIIIKFLNNEGVKPLETLTRLKAQFADTTQSKNFSLIVSVYVCQTISHLDIDIKIQTF